MNNTPVYPEGYLTDLLTQKAITFRQQKHRKPFFLALTCNAPHWPWQGPTGKPYSDSVRFTAGGSPAMMKSLDDGVGAVMKTLDRTGLSQNPLVIFINDNGGERYSSNGGLSKAKGTLWEGGIRVPAFVRWPGNIKPGQTTRQVAMTMCYSGQTIFRLNPTKSAHHETAIPLSQSVLFRFVRVCPDRAQRRKLENLGYCLG